MPESSGPAADRAVPQQWFEQAYGELKRLAHLRLHRDGRVADLDTTALVHESYLRLCERGALGEAERAVFFAYVGRVMRSVVVDRAREAQAAKRGGDAVAVTLTTGVAGVRLDDERLLALDAALDSLGRQWPELAELVETRYFAGLSLPEIAQLRGSSLRSVEREWTKARAFLQRLIDAQ